MYFDLDDCPQYSNALSEIFNNTNFNLRFCHGHPNYSENYERAKWVNKNTWDMFETTLSEVSRLINLPKTNVCKSFQNMNDNE